MFCHWHQDILVRKWGESTSPVHVLNEQWRLPQPPSLRALWRSVSQQDHSSPGAKQICTTPELQNNLCMCQLAPEQRQGSAFVESNTHRENTWLNFFASESSYCFSCRNTYSFLLYLQFLLNKQTHIHVEDIVTRWADIFKKMNNGV